MSQSQVVTGALRRYRDHLTRSNTQSRASTLIPRAYIGRIVSRTASHLWLYDETARRTFAIPLSNIESIREDR